MSAWRVASIVMAALFAVIIYESLTLPLLDKLGPGPGFFPLCLSILGIALATLLFFSDIPMEAAAGEVVAAQSDGGDNESGAWFRPLAVLVLIGAAAFAIDPPFGLPGMGFRLVALVFIAALLLALGVRNLIAIPLFAVLGSFGVFYVFNDWLKVILPVGNFGI